MHARADGASAGAQAAYQRAAAHDADRRGLSSGLPTGLLQMHPNPVSKPARQGDSLQLDNFAAKRGGDEAARGGQQADRRGASWERGDPRWDPHLLPNHNGGALPGPAEPAWGLSGLAGAVVFGALMSIRMVRVSCLRAVGLWRAAKEDRSPMPRSQSFSRADSLTRRRSGLSQM